MKRLVCFILGKLCILTDLNIKLQLGVGMLLDPGELGPGEELVLEEVWSQSGVVRVLGRGGGAPGGALRLP